MEVFILTQGAYEDEGPIGVYTSLRAAQDQCSVTTEWEELRETRIVAPGQLEHVDKPTTQWSGWEPKSDRGLYEGCYHIFKFELDADTDA